MGKVKEVLAELDNGQEVIITQWGVAMAFQADRAETYNFHLTVNDIESTMAVIRYLREARPFETLAEITGSHPQIDWGTTVLPTLPDAPVVTGNINTGGKRK